MSLYYLYIRIVGERMKSILYNFKHFFESHFSSIRNQLIISFVFLIMLPTSIISYVSYTKSTDSLTQKTKDVLEANFNLLEHSILKEVNMIDKVVKQIYLDDKMLELLSYSPNSKYVYLYTKYTAIPYASTLTRSNSFDNILRAHTSALNYANLSNSKLYVYNNGIGLYKFSSNVFDLEVVQSTDWYQNLSTTSVAQIMYINNATNQNSQPQGVNYIRRLFGLKNYKLNFSSLITIQLPMKEINLLLNNIKPTASSKLFIVDEQGRIISSTDQSLISDFLSETTLFDQFNFEKEFPDGFYNKNIIDNKDKLLLSTKKINELNWTIISTTPLDEINSELYKMQNLIEISIFIALIIGLFIALLLADKITSPIKKLVHSMSKLDVDNLYVEIEGYTGKDELSYLIQNYNKNNKRIRSLIRDLSRVEKEKKHAELEALQAQINPHFLYNTLDAINWMSMKHNAPDISIMVTSLSDFFRYSLSKGKAIIPLDNELRQTESYLTIQKIRFPDLIDYSIFCDVEIKDCPVVKLTLQPLVENAIIHGIEPEGESGFIQITCMKKENLIYIEVSDNGIGADVDVLNDALKNNFNSTTSYGIKNVHQRIKNYFGESYGLSFKRNEANGITVTISLPAIFDKEMLANVEDDYS